MALVGFSFTKINAERKSATIQNVNIESNAGVTNIIELQNIDAKKSLIKFDFDFVVKYEPNVGRIEIKGEVVEIYDRELGLKVLQHWTSDKKVYVEVMQELFNNILARSNVEAIVISRDLGLPSPLQMPRVDVKPVDEKDAKAAVKADKTEEKKEKAKK
jgi:hypothetical protein